MVYSVLSDVLNVTNDDVNVVNVMHVEKNVADSILIVIFKDWEMFIFV